MVILTFDDGYADNLLVAKPHLEAYDVPATVFVSSGFLGGGREFWWDRLERVTVHTGDDLIALRARVRALPQAALEGEVTRLESEAGIPDASPASHRCLTADETIRLVDGGLVEVGSHTVSHRALNMLSDAEQIEELAESKRTLEGLLDRPVVSLSYPFGGSGDLAPETSSLAAKCGYESACVTWPGTVCRGTDVMRLPRFVVRDWDGDAFARRLADWLSGRHVLDDF
jgi:peptidoglycan/xylan/chitin deacetylase (PgdA/CDA1 family)